MKKSEKTFSHKNLSYSPEKSGKKISNSNSSSLLQIKQINFVKEEDNSKNKDKQIFNSFYSLNEEVKNNANTQRDINSELYERLRNESVGFIKTLLRLKQKMNNQNKIYFSQENKRINNNNEKIENLKMKNHNKFPLEISPLNERDNKPIKILNSFKKVNFTENIKIKKNNSKSKENFSLKSSVSTPGKDKKTRVFFFSKELMIKQRTISAIPNNYKIKNMNKTPQKKKKNKKSLSTQNIIRIGKNGNYFDNNQKITMKNNPNYKFIKEIKEKKINNQNNKIKELVEKNKPIPTAVIDLFNDSFNKDKDNTKNVNCNIKRLHFTHKKFKKN